MILIDTNVLIELLISSHENHKKTWAAFNKLTLPVSLTNINIAECLRLLTHPRVFKNPLSMHRAVVLLEDFISSHSLVTLEDSNEWLEELRLLSRTDIADLRGNDVFDAKIALCMRHNGIKIIWTRDTDFKKYSFLKIIR